MDPLTTTPTVAELVLATMNVRLPENPHHTLRVLIKRPRQPAGGFTIMLVPQLGHSGLVWSYTGPVFLEL
jgi:hypothetical protein